MQDAENTGRLLKIVFRYKKDGRIKKYPRLLMQSGVQAVEKPLVNIKNGVAGAKPPTGSRGGSPSNIAPFLGKGAWGFGKDAEIERPKALQDAKHTKRSYRG